MLKLLQVAGALGVLVPFVWAQLGTLETTAVTYLAPNLVGSGLLAVVAGLTGNWGFLLLEGVWAVVACAALLRRRA